MIEMIDLVLDLVGKYTAILFLIELYKKNRIKIKILIDLLLSSVIVNPKLKEEAKIELIRYT